MTIRSGTKWIQAKDIPTLEWLDKKFILPPESGEFVGKYNIYYVPYFWGLANIINLPTTRVFILNENCTNRMDIFLDRLFRKANTVQSWEYRHCFS